jgi:hypothetical protein
MTISGLLGNADAIAGFGPPIEPLQQILNTVIDHFVAKSIKNPVDLMLFRIYPLYPELPIPLPAPWQGFQIDHLPGRGFPLRHDPHGVRVPLFIPKRWLREQFPHGFNRDCDSCCWTEGDAHTFSTFENAGKATLLIRLPAYPIIR